MLEASFFRGFSSYPVLFLFVRFYMYFLCVTIEEVLKAWNEMTGKGLISNKGKHKHNLYHNYTIENIH